jgi:hypothetical protein
MWIPHLAKKGQEAYWIFLLMIINELLKVSLILWEKLHGNMAKTSWKMLIPSLITHMSKSITFHYSI